MASKGGLEKQWVILIVIAVALAALVGLLFLTGTFVGQAIQFEEPTQDGEAGIFTGVDSTLDVGQKEVFPIIVNLGGSESQAVSYAYTVSGATLNCVATKDQTLDILSEYYVFEDVDKDGELVNISLLLGELNQVITCNPNTGVVTVEAAWICNGGCDNILEDQAEVGEVVLQANQVGDASIKFTSFTTLKTMEDEDVTNVVTSLSDASFAIVGTIEDLPGTELPDQGLVDTTGVDTTIDDNGLPAGSDTGAQPDGPLPGTDLPEQDLPDTTGVDTTVDDPALEFPPTSPLPKVCDGKGPKGNAVVACILHHIKELEKVNDNPSNLEYAQAVATGAKEYFKVQ